MKKLFLTLFISLFVVVFSINSQEKELNRTPVKKVFSELEKTHEVKFSFSDKLIDKVFISINLENKTLDKVLQEIESKTQLTFQKVTKRYIIVFDKKDHSKNMICGFLFDMISNKPIYGATILTSAKTIGTTTDKYGYFQLASISENDRLKITFIGYKPLTLSVKEMFKKPCKKVYLKEDTSVLDEISITNYLTNGISKKKDGSVLISSKKIEILPGLTEPDVLQSIQLLPGINSPNETVSGIHIRGGTPDQNLILFDGIKMYNSAHFFGMISAFNPYITEKIKVFRSGAGAKYGNHISGVIDIETDDKIVDKSTGGFGFNLTHADFFLKLKLKDNLSFSFSIRRSFTDIFNTNTFSKLSERVFQNTIISRDNNLADDEIFSSTDFNFIDFNSKIIYEPSARDKIIFNQLFVKNKLEHLFGLKDNTYKTSDILDIKNKGFSSKWIRDWKSNLTQKTSFYFSEYDFNYHFNENFSTPNQDQKGIKLNTIKDINFQTSFQIRKNLKSTYNFGYQFSNNNVSYKLERINESQPNFDYFLEESENNNTHALFGEYVYKNNEKLIFQIGVRSNYFSLTEKVFFAPRVYAQTLLSTKFWVKGSAEFKQQNISQLLELSTADFGLENQIWALSTKESIPLLKSKQFTFGFIYKKDNWTLDLDFYLKKITGLTSLSKGFQTVNNDYSEGENEVKGVDFLLQKNWDNYSSWISYSFSNAKFTFLNINRGNSFPGNYDIRHNFLWSHNLKIGNYNFSLGWNFRTGIPYTNAIGIDTNNQIIYQDELNKSRLPSYHKLDFSSTYSFNFSANKKWKGKIGLSLLNIYNEKNILQRNFSVQQDANNNLSISKADTFSLGFTPNVVFRVLF